MRCAEFYEKWKKDPNWCEKSPQAVYQIDHYLELVGELEKMGAATGAIYKFFPEGTAREVLKLKDGKVRSDILTNASGMIKRGERVTPKDLKVWLGISTKVEFRKQPEGVEEKEPQKEPEKISAKRPATHDPMTIRNTPEDKPAADIFHRSGSSGVVARKTDYETMAKEGDLYPLTRRAAQVINQMVEYEIARDRLEASAMLYSEGCTYWLEEIDTKLGIGEAATA
jgi:hypothetical protein